MTGWCPCPASCPSPPSGTPTSSTSSTLVAPPYDVLSDADLDHYLALDEHNITHVDVPRGGDDRYRDAAGDARRLAEARVSWSPTIGRASPSTG